MNSGVGGDGERKWRESPLTSHQISSSSVVNRMSVCICARMDTAIVIPMQHNQHTSAYYLLDRSPPHPPSSGTFSVQGLSTSIQVLSGLRIAAGLSAFIAPAFLTNKLYGFTTRSTSGSSATATSTTAKLGAPEETLQAIRLVGSRDIILGLALRDSTAIVVERAVELGFISSVIDLIATGYSFFVEGSLSPEVATASATVAAIGAAFQYYIRAV
ncbi:hypothetical protein EMMF5_003241 [Cystobasidiomycetes sp. EMM_F5]